MTEREHNSRFEVPGASLNQFYFAVAKNSLDVAIEALKQGQMWQEKAEIDGLSHVLTRDAFVNRFERSLSELRRQPRHGSPDAIALILFDGDNFKGVNDDYGHAAGDNVVRVIGDALHVVRKDQDVAGRLGGDEFVLQLSITQAEHTEQTIHTVMERLQTEANELLQAEDPRPESISFSYGWAAAERAQATTFDEMYSQADQKLYEMKRQRHRGNRRD